MSDYRLNTFVHAVEVNANGARTGRERVFGPADDLSTPENEWALAAITNGDVWADGNVPDRKPAPAPSPVEDDEVARLKARIAELERAAKPPVDETPGPKVPPQQGPGSNAGAWRAYAAAVDVEVPADASREDVIAALTAADKPTK